MTPPVPDPGHDVRSHPAGGTGTISNGTTRRVLRHAVRASGKALAAVMSRYCRARMASTTSCWSTARHTSRTTPSIRRCPRPDVAWLRPLQLVGRAFIKLYAPTPDTSRKVACLFREQQSDIAQAQAGHVVADRSCPGSDNRALRGTACSHQQRRATTSLQLDLPVRRCLVGLSRNLSSCHGERTVSLALTLP